MYKNYSSLFVVSPLLFFLGKGNKALFSPFDITHHNIIVRHTHTPFTEKKFHALCLGYGIVADTIRLLLFLGREEKPFSKLKQV